MFLIILSITWLLSLCVIERIPDELMDRARKGDDEAQFQVGQCYIFGNGVEQDYVKAKQWLQNAAGKGHAKAQFFIGLLFFNGHGVEQDLDQANQWFTLADESGFKEGKQILRIITLGFDESLYNGGDGTSVDKAVIINTRDRMLGVRAEYKYIEHIATKKGLSYRTLLQSLLHSNSRVFDKIDIIWEGDQEESFFFDITEFFYFR